MQPSLAHIYIYIDDCDMVEFATLAVEWQRNSTRHQAISTGGLVVVGLQWHGVRSPPALAALLRRSGPLRPLSAPAKALQDMRRCVSSIAFAADLRRIPCRAGCLRDCPGA